MSGPYNNQGGYGYNQQPQYGGSYNDPNAYPQQPQYGGQPGYNNQQQEFAPIHRQDSYGPPQHGGFQQGIQGYSYGQYNNSNPQGHSGYYGQQQPQYGQPQYQGSYGGQNDAFAANQAYQNQMSQGGQGSGAPTGTQPDINNYQFAKQSSDPNAPNYDPNAPPMSEQDRGLLGALGGGFAGHHFGGKQGHGFLGTVGGAILGSFAEDFMKKKKNESKYGGSQWGGSKW